MAKPKLNQEQRITLAQIQAIEGTYGDLKTRLEIAQNDARLTKASYNRLAGQVESLIEEIDEEEDEITRQNLRTALDKRRKELEELDTETTVKEATKAQLKSDIDRSIEDMKELPGVRDAIQELVAKRYDKEIERLGKEQEKEVKDKENLEKITELVDEDKTDNAQDIRDSFKDMLNARNDMKKVKAEITDLDERIAIATDVATRDSLNQQRADKLTELGGVQAKYQTAKTKFITASKDADVEFEEADVDHLVAVVNDGMKRRDGDNKNNYSLDEVLQKQLSKTGKNIELLGAQKAEYEKGKPNIAQEQTQQQGQPSEGGPNNEEQETKFNWRHPFHSIRVMWERNQIKRLEAYNQQPSEQQQQQPDNKKAHKAFVKELQRNATIDAIVNREMRETRDRAADIKRSFEENDRDN